jgi:glycosyltransferase involved in cell wall biosynthesis
MKVLFAVHHFPPRHAAGAELRARDAAAWLLKQGHDVHVVCVEHVDRGPDDGVLWEDDEYERIPVRRLSFDMSKAPDRFRWEYDNPWIEKHLRDFLAQVRPDVFHLVSGYLLGAGALRAARTLHIPIVITLTDFWFLCPRVNLLRPDGTLSSADEFDAAACTRCWFEERRRFRIPARMVPGATDWFWRHVFDSGWGELFGCSEIGDRLRQRNRTLTEILSAADVLICPSRFLLEKFRARGITSRKLVLNVHGLDSSNWLPVSDVDRPDHAFCIGYLGQIDSHKGVHLLVEAFTQLRSRTPLELVIHGDETAFPRYTRRLRKLARGDGRVKMLGRYEPRQVAQLLAQIDVLVIPSTWNEIGPLVMYEALQTRTPVVASDIPNMSDVVRHEENGLLFACGDGADLAGQLQRLLDEPDLVSRLRDGIEPVKTMAEEMDTLQDVYRSLRAPRVAGSRRLGQQRIPSIGT